MTSCAVQGRTQVDGVIQRELVDDRILTGAREALDYVKVFARAMEGRPVREIRGIDHQRAVLPMAA